LPSAEIKPEISFTTTDSVKEKTKAIVELLEVQSMNALLGSIERVLRQGHWFQQTLYSFV
jgi:hypothetical protein